MVSPIDTIFIITVTGEKASLYKVFLEAQKFVRKAQPRPLSEYELQNSKPIPEDILLKKLPAEFVKSNPTIVALFEGQPEANYVFHKNLSLRERDKSLLLLKSLPTLNTMQENPQEELCCA